MYTQIGWTLLDELFSHSLRVWTCPPTSILRFSNVSVQEYQIHWTQLFLPQIAWKNDGILFVLSVLIQNYITILWSVLSQISWPATSGILGPCHHIPWEDVEVYIHIKVHRSHFQHLRRIGIKFLFHTALCKKAVRVDAVWNRNMSPILHNPCVSWRCVL